MKTYGVSRTKFALKLPLQEPVREVSVLFTEKYTWHGGFYELAIELGPRSEARFEAALQAIWQNERLEGCYVQRDLEPSEQGRIKPSLEMLEEYGHLLGVATPPGGDRAACGTAAIRQEDDIDWIAFYLPMGALETIYDVEAYPFVSGLPSQTWRVPLDDWLVEIAQHIFAVTPFALGLIGHEVSGYTTAAEISVKKIPEKRWCGYLWQENEKLVWYPPTDYTAPFEIG